MFIEIPSDNNGAGGLAHHGVHGISVGSSFLEGLLKRWRAGARSVDQVYYYEMCRNFWFGDYNPRIDYCCDNNKSCYGWWTVGFNNAMSVIVSEITSTPFYYFGQSREQFARGMLKDFESYVEDPKWCWENSWVCSRMPWRKEQSINNMMSGFIIEGFKRFGGKKWIQGVYRELGRVEVLRGGGEGRWQGVRDNVYLIWSKAAGRDLREYFEKKLRWKISERAKRHVGV